MNQSGKCQNDNSLAEMESNSLLSNNQANLDQFNNNPSFNENQVDDWNQNEELKNIDFISLISETVSKRKTKSIEQANKTTIMFTQYEPMLASLKLITSMRKNVQSHLLAQFTTGLIRYDLNSTS